jgi:hypothetical protein
MNEIRRIREIFQKYLKDKPLTPESIAEMFDPIKERRYYEMFMQMYERQEK